MYEEVTGTGISAGTAPLLSEDGLSQMATSEATQTHNTGFSENVGLSMENLDAIANTAFTNGASATSAFIMEQNPFGNTHLVEQVNHNHRDSYQLGLSFDHSTWDTSSIQDHHRQHHNHDQHQPLLYSTPPDRRHLVYSLPTAASTFSFVNSPIPCENPPTQKTINLQNPTGHGGLVGGSYPNMGSEGTNVSSVLHLNPPARAPALRELFQSLPSRSDFLIFGGEDDRDFDDNGDLRFTRDTPSVGRRGGGRGKGIKQVTNEKQRRVEFSSKFDALRELIPNPTKNDRASVLWDAIEYIQELRRSVNDLTLLVDKKRCGKERFKRHKVEEAEEALEDIESCNLKPLGEPDHHLQPYNECIIKSSWLQRKSKDTEVDVRIVEDEVTIKLVQRKKKIDCLLYASKALDELELDIQHVAGGHIGDFCSFLFNSKIYEGSSVYASAIANKLMEVMNRNFQTA